MAIIALHRRITRDALRQAKRADGKPGGFTEGAIAKAMDANEAIDTDPGNQGSGADRTVLHAMRGFAADASGIPRLQTQDQARDAVRRRLDGARADIAAALKKKEYDTAIRLLGGALHTVQDSCFHHWEAWPYSGIWEGIKAQPGYMLYHGVRDVGWTRYVVAGSGAADGGRVGIAAEIGLSTDTTNPFIPNALGLGGNYQMGGDDPAGWTGMLSLCWGACPGTGASPTTSRARVPTPLGAETPSPVFRPEWTVEYKRQQEELEKAEEKSRDYVDTVRAAAAPADWDAFLKWPG